MRRVYVIMVKPNISSEGHLSSVGYDTLEKAQEFISRRSDVPVRLNNFLYMGERCYYIIQEVAVK